MHVYTGTSGYSYKEWKGRFYPDDLPAARMLSWYGERFTTVEINNTFYRMPSAATLEQWAAQVPEGFRFALKAPQRITHQKKLKDAEDDVAHLVEVSRTLGARLGPILFQLPPYLRKDAGLLRSFLGNIPADVRTAFEFRHVSWRDAEVEDALRERDAALCIAETDESPGTAITPTAAWGYLRLRRTSYEPGELARWAAAVEAQAWSTAWVYFKHEDEAKGPEFAREFIAQLKG